MLNVIKLVFKILNAKFFRTSNGNALRALCKWFFMFEDLVYIIYSRIHGHGHGHRYRHGRGTNTNTIWWHK